MKKYIGMFRSLILIAVLASTLLATSVFAADSPSVFIERLNGGNYVGVKIIFPNDLNGSFGGTFNGRQHFDCTLVSSNTLYCMGPMQPGAGFGTLSIYNKDGGEVIFSTVVASPRKPGEPAPEPCEIGLGFSRYFSTNSCPT